jgi:hypothetical protein
LLHPLPSFPTSLLWSLFMSHTCLMYLHVLNSQCTANATHFHHRSCPQFGKEEYSRKNVHWIIYNVGCLKLEVTLNICSTDNKGGPEWKELGE